MKAKLIVVVIALGLLAGCTASPKSTICTPKICDIWD